MKFEELINGKLWAVREDDSESHELEILLDHWNNVVWLREFFINNIDDINAHYHVSIEDAIWDTIEDSEELENLLMELGESDDLDKMFRPLNNNETAESVLQKDKTRIATRPRHSSWLRIYAIRLSTGAYIITGGAIKLTFRMEDREHTRHELTKIERVKNFLLSEHIIDDDSFIEYIAEL